jgi:hypothetical protein
MPTHIFHDAYLIPSTRDYRKIILKRIDLYLPDPCHIIAITIFGRRYTTTIWGNVNIEPVQGRIGISVRLLNQLYLDVAFLENELRDLQRGRQLTLQDPIILEW